MTSTQMLIGEPGQEPADGMQGPTHRLGDPRPAGTFVTAHHGQNLGLLGVLVAGYQL
jgi:hypothetical protein